MPPSQPQLGSLAVHAPSLKPQTVHVSSSTCHNLSLFKSILNEYRRLDDTIIMRLNRAESGMRDRDRTQGLSGSGTVQDEACESIWRELVANWKRRTQLVDYCVSVVDQSSTESQTELETQHASSDDPARRKIRGVLHENAVKRKQTLRELTIEEIVRKRSAEAFRTRCQYFVPPSTDEEARKMWDAALARK